MVVIGEMALVRPTNDAAMAPVSLLAIAPARHALAQVHAAIATATAAIGRQALAQVPKCVQAAAVAQLALVLERHVNARLHEATATAMAAIGKRVPVRPTRRASTDLVNKMPMPPKQRLRFFHLVHQMPMPTKRSLRFQIQ